MLRIAICDDDIKELENTYKMICEFAETKPEIDFYIRRFQSAYDMLECINTGINFNIYILDVIMPLMNGIDVGAKIREKDENAVIIYLTTSPDYAVKSYSVFAFQYLLKPVNQKELFIFLGKAIDKINFKAFQSFPVKTKQGVTAVRYHTIMFIEYSNHIMVFHLSDTTVLISVILREPFDIAAAEILKDYRFIKPHVSFIVNLSFVSDISKKDFILKNDTLIPISKNIYTEVKKKYIDFLLKGAEPEKC